MLDADSVIIFEYRDTQQFQSFIVFTWDRREAKL